MDLSLCARRMIHLRSPPSRSKWMHLKNSMCQRTLMQIPTWVAMTLRQAVQDMRTTTTLGQKVSPVIRVYLVSSLSSLLLASVHSLGTRARAFHSNIWYHVNLLQQLVPRETAHVSRTCSVNHLHLAYLTLSSNLRRQLNLRRPRSA